MRAAGHMRQEIRTSTDLAYRETISEEAYLRTRQQGLEFGRAGLEQQALHRRGASATTHMNEIQHEQVVTGLPERVFEDIQRGIPVPGPVMRAAERMLDDRMRELQRRAPRMTTDEMEDIIDEMLEDGAGMENSTITTSDGAPLLSTAHTVIRNFPGFAPGEVVVADYGRGVLVGVDMAADTVDREQSVGLEAFEDQRPARGSRPLPTGPGNRQDLSAY